MAKQEIVHAAAEAVKYARELCDDVEFSPEDASRTELEFLAEVVERAIEAGATTINVPDTVGYTVPDEFCEVFRVPASVTCRGIERATLSVHCHNDLGMAVANSLAAVRAGARQIECTINGIGERAGNCSLEEVVMALKTREAYFGLTTGIDTRRLYPTSRLLSNITGIDDSAQQGDRRRERVRPRVGHPPARHAASITRPTRSCGPRTSASRARTSCSASTADATRSASASRSSASSSTRPS